MASAAVAAPAPQQLVQVHQGHTLAPTATFVRTVEQPAAQSHRHHTTVHSPATRTTTITRAAVPTAVVHHAAAPVQHVVHQAVAPVQRIVHQAAPAIVRTVPALVEHVEHVEEQGNPNYSFGYSVADVKTGDAKTREETRDGDVITGSYTVADPDGRLRRVTYTADHINGFQATVTYDGQAGPVAIPIDAPKSATVVQQTPAFVPFVSAAAPAPAPAENIVVAARAQEAEAEDDEVQVEVAGDDDSSDEADAGVRSATSSSSVFTPATPFTTTVLRNGDVHANHKIHTLAAAPVAHTVAVPHNNGQFVRFAGANGHTFAVPHNNGQLVRFAGADGHTFAVPHNSGQFVRFAGANDHTFAVPHNSGQFVRLANADATHGFAVANNNGQFVRLANADAPHAFAATPFGLRAFPSNSHFVNSNGGFVRAVHQDDAGTTLVHHAWFSLNNKIGSDMTGIMDC